MNCDVISWTLPYLGIKRSGRPLQLFFILRERNNNKNAPEKRSWKPLNKKLQILDAGLFLDEDPEKISSEVMIHFASYK